MSESKSAVPPHTGIPRPDLLRIFLVFLKMGATAFGGNVAMVAAIRREISEKRKWVKDEEILDLMVVGNVLPGPLATNVVFACGKILCGVSGAFMALFAVILPSFLLMCFLSWAYFNVGTNTTITSVMNGIIPCVAAIIAATGWNLYRKNVKGWTQHVILIASGVALLMWKGFFLTLIIVGVSGVAGRLILYSRREKKVQIPNERSVSVFVLPIITLLVFVVLYFLPEYSLSFTNVKKVACTFGSMSVTLFGGGYVFIPAMKAVVVDQLSWLTAREFSEGIAMGQITPGPIMISSVFIGWKVAGAKGAIAAAISLFVPPAVVMYVAQHFMQKLKANDGVEAIFKGVRPAVIGMIFTSVWTVFSTGNVNWISLTIFAAAFGISIWKNPEPVLLILGSALLGYFIG